MKKYINLTSWFLFVVVLVSSCYKEDAVPEASDNPTITAVSPAQGPGGTLLTVSGAGLGQMKTVVFATQNVPASFNPTMNSDNNILFRVPDTAFGGTQDIILTNTLGKEVKVSFSVVALATVTDASNFNYVAGSQIMLTGNNLETVTKVVFTGTTTEAPIVSKTRKQLVITMPAPTTARTKLDITNSSGTITTSQEFVSLNHNFIMYADAWGPGAYGSGVQSWSWGCNVSEVTDDKKTGTKALKVAYTDGGLSLFLGSDWGTPALNFTDFHVPYPAYLSFWAKSVGSKADISIVPDGGAGSFTATGSTTVEVPADTWKYYKIPANFITGKFARINLRNNAGKTVYFDDILWIK